MKRKTTKKLVRVSRKAHRLLTTLLVLQAIERLRETGILSSIRTGSWEERMVSE